MSASSWLLDSHLLGVSSDNRERERERERESTRSLASILIRVLISS